MSKEQDDFCPACRCGLCVHCFLASREWDNPDACLCDCEQAILARDELRREQGIPERTYYPAAPQESKETPTDLAKLSDAMNQGSIGEIVDILFPGRGY